DSKGEIAKGAEAVVVVIGEEPYAEGMGDDFDLEMSEEDQETVTRAKVAGVPIVVILLSGRPMVLGPILEQPDAMVAAWLAGTEGRAVAEVLFGDYDPTGKLPFSWPRSVLQHPLNEGSAAAYDPLFAFGYGLSYEE